MPPIRTNQTRTCMGQLTTHGKLNVGSINRTKITTTSERSAANPHLKAYAQTPAIKTNVDVSSVVWSESYLHPFFVYTHSKGFGESAHLRGLAWAFVARKCGNNVMCLLKCVNWRFNVILTSFDSIVSKCVGLGWVRGCNRFVWRMPRVRNSIISIYRFFSYWMPRESCMVTR